MNSRQDHLKFCKTCTQRKFDPKKGIVCSLTGEWADFDHECANYNLDSDAQIRETNSEKEREERRLSTETGGLSKFGIKNGGVAGLIILVLGLIWLIGGIVYLNLIFYYSFVVILFGLLIIINYNVQLYQSRKKKALAERHEDILDQ